MTADAQWVNAVVLVGENNEYGQGACSESYCRPEMRWFGSHKCGKPNRSDQVNNEGMEKKIFQFFSVLETTTMIHGP